MKINVSKFFKGKDFEITGPSYIGAPRSNTAMFISRKAEYLLPALFEVENCLVFAETGIHIDENLLNKHAFVISKNPQLEYARFADYFAKEREKEERTLNCTLHPKGYYLYDNVKIGSDAYIEPGCVIGPDVRIGARAKILSGTVIRRSDIGDDFVANENSVVGANGFTMAEDEEGNKLRIPTLGRVIIGNNVEVGSHNNISCGSGGCTILEDNVKLDSLIHIGHDVHLHRNVEITAGVTVGGFAEIGESA